ncbi:oligopeptide ABC transporter permease OppB [Stagnimonas aquatica]|uniref:Oligopeptide ABC transporter permease OppB n=1 Tax=Stagnimonas aquatica TaxID=2689987 RepID=A0A3N0VH25_9GAMM|nr:oligopeptide ABC transporter permease OppB [Stagnimonas aquatica]ROH91981.1 oligopeptide ABC transporter permease OppB [Stagnimonas aquatica]
MSRYALLRLLTALPTLLLLVTLSFFLMRLAPGGPFDGERSLPPEIEASLRAEYHLDEPLPQQYLRYLGGLLRGDLGPSFQYQGFRVRELIAAGLPVSLSLGLLAMALALLLGGATGVVASLRPGSVLDRGLMSLAMLGISVPSYVVGPLLVLLFAVLLRWLPAGGWEPGRWSDLLLPVLALALPQIAAIARLLRGSMLEVLRQPYIRTARAKGLPESRVVLVHALKPALLPVLSYLGPATAGLITGSVVVEQVFGLPGIGRYFVQGALNRDYTLVLGVVLVYGAMIVLFNFLVDLLYGLLDPRLRRA